MCSDCKQPAEPDSSTVVKHLLRAPRPTPANMVRVCGGKKVKDLFGADVAHLCLTKIRMREGWRGFLAYTNYSMLIALIPYRRGLHAAYSLEPMGIQA